MPYKWATPHHWLRDWIATGDDQRAALVLSLVLQHLDSDTIQDIFQADMDADGYFNAEPKDA